MSYLFQVAGDYRVAKKANGPYAPKYALKASTFTRPTGNQATSTAKMARAKLLASDVLMIRQRWQAHTDRPYGAKARFMRAEAERLKDVGVIVNWKTIQSALHGDTWNDVPGCEGA